MVAVVVAPSLTLLCYVAVVVAVAAVAVAAVAAAVAAAIGLYCTAVSIRFAWLHSRFTDPLLVVVIK